MEVVKTGIDEDVEDVRLFCKRVDFGSKYSYNYKLEVKRGDNWINIIEYGESYFNSGKRDLKGDNPVIISEPSLIDLLKIIRLSKDNLEILTVLKKLIEGCRSISFDIDPIISAAIINSKEVTKDLNHKSEQEFKTFEYTEEDGFDSTIQKVIVYSFKNGAKRIDIDFGSMHIPIYDRNKFIGYKENENAGIHRWYEHVSDLDVPNICKDISAGDANRIMQLVSGDTESLKIVEEYFNYLNSKNNVMQSSNNSSEKRKAFSFDPID